MTLLHLATKAVALATQHPCLTHGHIWEFEGGRQCPVCGDNPECSQSVFVCRRCGVYDHGEEGGPGHAETLETHNINETT